MFNRRKFLTATATALVLSTAMPSAMAQQAAELRMGLLLPVSGPLAFVGGTMKKAFDLLIEQINANGGMNGVPVKVFFYDTESNTTLVAQQFRRLAESDKVDIVIGPTVTGETLVARPIANELKVPMIPFAGTEAVINPVTPYMFAFIPSDRHVARKMLEMVKSQGKDSVAFLHSADGFGQTGLKVMKELTDEMGMKLAVVEEFGPRDSDMTPQIMRIRSSNADAMFVWGVNPGPTIIMKNARAVGYNKPIINSYGVASQSFIEQTGKNGDGSFVIGTAIMGAKNMPPESPVRKATEQFINDYEARYKEPIGAFAGYVFDAINLVNQAVHKTNGKVDRESLAAAFRDGGLKFTGANGNLEFKQGSSTAQSEQSEGVVALQIKNGRFVLAQ